MAPDDTVGALVRLRTRDEYDGMFGKVCGLTGDGDVLVKHRPIKFPMLRATTIHRFKLSEIQVVRN
jgi:hypothetical protein